MKKHTPKQHTPASETSWNKVAGWYDELLKTDADSYQAKVITPNLLRVLDIKKGERMYDLACGQGYFSTLFREAGATVTASDISRRLIDAAKKHSSKNITWHVSPADKAPFLSDGSVDTVVIVLALQNIKNVSDVFALCSRVLTKNGRIVIVLNHPSFRVPQGSDWYFSEGIQYRMVGTYLSESTVTIDMTPGEKNPRKKVTTLSFHRPLQYYVKLFSKHGFALTRLEEWISHKKSQNGPRQGAEDTARKEIPLFMCLEVKKLH